MCIAFFLWQCNPHYRFFLALNRDELHSRPTLPVHWWKDSDSILAGKDLVKGGTWFGCTEDGRIALVTSFREPTETLDAISRGHLIKPFLKSSKSPLEYAQEVYEARDKYSGFNLLVADLCLGNMAYVSNRPKDNPVQVQSVMPGFHVLCNASLNTPWPKAIKGGGRFHELIKADLPYDVLKERVFNEVLMDAAKADVGSLPETGCPLEWEYHMSPIFVNCVGQRGTYGTRSMIIFSVDKDSKGRLFERYIENGCWKEHEFSFDLPEFSGSHACSDKAA
ncbi:hypothetical protein KP509_24G018200 [Ceratopteris richardii]|uniref:Uncharacterized protein n=1 Tax=Ceratopteris richardii TaxID=49495 RepID=A0A8T2RTL2_CERRI|nr:hypothetical protein KP509_24G018200 [Ceratopteris richardii]